jgi:hypothetical protein
MAPGVAFNADGYGERAVDVSGATLTSVEPTNPGRARCSDERHSLVGIDAQHRTKHSQYSVGRCLQGRVISGRRAIGHASMRRGHPGKRGHACVKSAPQFNEEELTTADRTMVEMAPRRAFIVMTAEGPPWSHLNHRAVCSDWRAVIRSAPCRKGPCR